MPVWKSKLLNRNQMLRATVNNHPQPAHPFPQRNWSPVQLPSEEARLSQGKIKTAEIQAGEMGLEAAQLTRRNKVAEVFRNCFPRTLASRNSKLTIG